MNDSNHKKIHEFSQSLKEALQSSDSQSEQIATEVQSDLETHIESLIAKGHPENEAVEIAIEEMGNPFELAHHMKQEIPPFGGRALTIVRYIIASMVIVWTLVMLWFMRANNYGFSGTLICIIVLLHLPAILLIWPRIVWRRNYLFGLIPAGLVLAVTFVFALGGVEGETTSIPIPVEGVEQPWQPPLEPDSSPDPRRAAVPISIGLSIFSLILLLAVQQRSQRRTAILAVLLGTGAVETAYQIEESLFRKDQKKIYAYLEDFLRENEAYPTKEEFDPSELELTSPLVFYYTDDSSQNVFWTRPLSHGYSIVSESNGRKIRIQD